MVGTTAPRATAGRLFAYRVTQVRADHLPGHPMAHPPDYPLPWAGIRWKRTTLGVGECGGEERDAAAVEGSALCRSAHPPDALESINPSVFASAPE